MVRISKYMVGRGRYKWSELVIDKMVQNVMVRSDCKLAVCCRSWYQVYHMVMGDITVTV